MVVVYQLAMIAFKSSPAEQFCLSEVLYVSSIHFSIHCGAPFLVSLQVDQPYFYIVTVRYHNLLRTHHLNINTPKICTFHFLPEQGISVAVSMEKNNTRFTVSTIMIVLLSLLLHQKYESVVEGSERIANIIILFSKANGNHFLLKHRWLSIICYIKQSQFIVPNHNKHQKMQQRWISCVWSLITIVIPLSKTYDIRGLQTSHTERSLIDSHRLINTLRRSK